MMRKYDDEFKQSAVKKILDGQSVASLSRELGVAESLLHKRNWWKTASSNRSRMRDQRSSATSKVITIGSDSIRA